MLMMENEINYKEAYEALLKEQRKDQVLSSILIEISTKQLNLIFALKKGRQNVWFVEKGCRYIDEMKYDFIVSYADELWRELRYGLRDDILMEDEEVRIEKIRAILIGLKDKLRLGEGWELEGVPILDELVKALEQLHHYLMKQSNSYMDASVIESYYDLVKFYIDAYQVGLLLKSQCSEKKLRWI